MGMREELRQLYNEAKKKNEERLHQNSLDYIAKHKNEMLNGLYTEARKGKPYYSHEIKDFTGINTKVLIDALKLEEEFNDLVFDNYGEGIVIYFT